MVRDFTSTTIIHGPADMVTAADFDLDGSPEYVIGWRTSSELLVCSEVDPATRDFCRIGLAVQPVALASADFDGDGVPELVVALADAQLQLLVPRPGLNFSLEVTLPIPDVACDLDVHQIGSQAFLIVATATRVQVLSPIHAPQMRPLASEPVDQAAHRLELIRQRANPDVDAPGMTSREREVVSLALTGLSARAIGSRLFIADRTVETHLAHAYAKLGVRSRFELIGRLDRARRAFD